jgi:hypothetical protein
MTIRPLIWAATGAVALLAAGGLASASSAAALNASGPAAGVRVSPAAVSLGGDGPGGCIVPNYPLPTNQNYVCTFRIAAAPGSTKPIAWNMSTAARFDGTSGGDEVTYQPASGILKPGQSVTVQAAVGCDDGVAFLVNTSGSGSNGSVGGAAVYYLTCG